MKRIFILLIACVMLLTSVSCGSYHGAINDPDATNKTNGSSPGGDDPVVENGETFSVTLMCDGQPFYPGEEITAQWTDVEGFSFKSAHFNQDGKATVTGLDGDYTVTLSAVPQGYTYNPNVHKATNNQKDIVIEIYRPVIPTKSGKDLYQNIIEISTPGVYRATLSPDKRTGKVKPVYFEFTPLESGTYSVESWADITAQSLDPKLDVYYGSSAYKVYAYTLDDGGVSAEYTSNFRYEINIDESSIGQAFTFGVWLTEKHEEYPASVDIAIQLNGEFSRSTYDHQIIIPKEQFVQTPEYDRTKYEFVGAETPYYNTNLFDGANYKFWPKSEGGDDYYHVYNEELYASTGGYGPILYAKISQPCRFIEAAFTNIEDAGNKALTVNGYENYKLFIQGYDALIIDPPALEVGPYFCLNTCPCYLGTCECKSKYGRDCRIGSCIEDCPECDEDCRHCPAEGVGNPGYASYCNSDGVYAVTQELKEFLQKFSVSQSLFRDGYGWVESNPTISVDAKEEDQWLFACGYYKLRGS